MVTVFLCESLKRWDSGISESTGVVSERREHNDTLHFDVSYSNQGRPIKCPSFCWGSPI